MDRDSIYISNQNTKSRNSQQKVEDIYLFNDRAAITFSYRSELYDKYLGSFSRLFGAEVYVGAIWNSLVWRRPDICFFKDELRDEILAMLITTAISHEIIHELIDEIEISHLVKADFEERILHELDVAYQKEFIKRITSERRRDLSRPNFYY